MSGHRRLQVKAILLKEGVEEGLTEIRRFRVDEEEEGGVGTGLLQTLLTRVLSVFNVDPSVHQCALYWKDDDGDLIQFSTDEELAHALDVMRDDTFRLYVTLSEGDMEEGGEPANERHVTFDVTACPARHEHCTDPSAATRLGCPGMMGWGQGRDRRAWKAACMMGKKMEAAKNKEFQQVRQQVPEEFRGWVRQYVRLWITKGHDAALQAFTSTTGDKKLPQGVPEDFPHWLHTFLTRHHAHLAPSSSPHTGPGESEMEGVVEGEMRVDGEGPEGLPPVYFRWLCLFLPRFRARLEKFRAASADSEGDEGRGALGEGQKRKGQRGQGKHGCRGGKGGRGGEHGAQCAVSSESEESDGEQKAWKKVPTEFRHYARVTVIQLHKKKGDNSENKEKATRAGLTPEVQEFVEQVLLEWHAKLSGRRPRAVAMEMMAEERTLPAGVEPHHFLWLCRFLGRWHRRHAGKCDVMSGWSSGETTTDDTSGEETTFCAGQGPDYGPWPRHHRRDMRAVMRMMRGGGRPPYGMMGHHHPPPHHHPFAAMHSGAPAAYYSSCPLPARCCRPPRCGARRCGRMMGACSAPQDGADKRWKEEDGAAAATLGQESSRAQREEAVSHVTEGVKKM